MAVTVRNIYCPLLRVKTKLNLTSSTTTYDDLLLDHLEDGSRVVDNNCNRFFYLLNDTQYFDGNGCNSVTLPIDIISITSLKVNTTAGTDDTYDTTIPATDYRLSTLGPSGSRNGTAFDTITIWRSAATQKVFPLGDSTIEITGTFGFTESDNVWETTAITGSVADTTSTTVTINTEGTIAKGDTIKIDSEVMFVSGASTNSSKTLTVSRSGNGSTAATHSASAISVMTYPKPIEAYVLEYALDKFHTVNPGVFQESLAGHFYAKRDITNAMDRVINKYLRVNV